MEMMICPACNKKTPPDIGQCVRCGADLRSTQQAPALREPGAPYQAVTIEATSKKVKGNYLKAVGLCCLGVVLLIAGFSEKDATLGTVGSLTFLAGIIWYFVTRFKAWWHHG